MKLFIFIHGTVNIPGFDSLQDFAHRVGKAQFPKVLTGSYDEQLIPYAQAPACMRQFDDLYTDIDANNRYYFQWNGKLREHAWDTAAAFLQTQITEKHGNGEETTTVVIVAHSHGGNVARLTAESILKDTTIQFELITIAMPLSSNPKTTMPDNVVKWHQYYNPWDLTQFLGGVLMGRGILSGLFHAKRTMDQSGATTTQCVAIACWSADPHNALLTSKRTARIVDHELGRSVEAKQTSHTLRNLILLLIAMTMTALLGTFLPVLSPIAGMSFLAWKILSISSFAVFPLGVRGLAHAMATPSSQLWGGKTTRALLTLVSVILLSAFLIFTIPSLLAPLGAMAALTTYTTVQNIAIGSALVNTGLIAGAETAVFTLGNHRRPPAPGTKDGPEVSDQEKHGDGCIASTVPTV